jgi:diguanylate cyclase (GGDEF)-like protein/PAS domain S-box-containing protein
MSAVFQASSYQFSWFAVPVLTIGAANCLLGLATVRRERGSAVSVGFCGICISLGIWLIGLGAAYSTDDRSVAIVWARFSLLGTVFLPVLVLAGASSVGASMRAVRVLALGGFALSIILAAIVVSTGWLLADVHRYYWGYYPIYGWVGPILVGYMLLYLALSGHVYRVSYRVTQSVNQRRRLKLFLAGFALANPAVADFLPTFHIGIYPFGYLCISAFVAIVGFAIWRYRLVDITPALAARQVINTMSEGLLVVDRDGVVRVANDAAAGVWNLERGVVGTPVATLDARWGEDALMRLIDPTRKGHADVTYRDQDGALRTVVVSSSKLSDHQDVWVGTVFILHDITERWQAELALRESEERFRSLVQNASDLITVIDPDTTILYQSPAIKRVLGVEAEATVGQKLADVVHPDDRAGVLASLGEVMAKPSSVVAGEGRVMDSDGLWRHLEFTGSDQRDNKAIGGVVLNVRDVSERKQLEEQLRHQALHDPLTNLSNRTRFTDRVEHALERGMRSGESLTVMFMDLDNFKAINDSLGHAAGDSLLIQVAGRVGACLRPADTIARLGGDEFAILLEAVSTAQDAIPVVERIFDALQTAFCLDGKDILVRASIGIATSEGNEGYDVDGLLRDADVAMYVAKSQGKGCYRVFEPGMQVSMIERLELVADLQRALDRDEFVIHYQPMVLLRSGRLSGWEALVRWRHPRRGLMPPAEFIPLAEESGVILRLGNWVLTQACRHAATWYGRYPSGNDLWMSVNVSVKQLQSPTFVAEVAQALGESGLDPHQLILEITESVMMQHVPSTLKRLHELKALGVGLAIDDFGTGYSSLSYLRQFPFDLLKIDKSFIDDLGAVVNPKELTRAIVELGKTLDLKLVAEGIERREQLDRLISIECDFGQGFYFAEPMEGAAVEELLSSLSVQADAA